MGGVFFCGEIKKRFEKGGKDGILKIVVLSTYAPLFCLT
jgi:hypothetical protein